LIEKTFEVLKRIERLKRKVNIFTDKKHINFYYFYLLVISPPK